MTWFGDSTKYNAIDEVRKLGPVYGSQLQAIAWGRRLIEFQTQPEPVIRTGVETGISDDQNIRMYGGTGTLTRRRDPDMHLPFFQYPKRIANTKDKPRFLHDHSRPVFVPVVLEAPDFLLL